jgi:hypothetical protein
MPTKIFIVCTILLSLRNGASENTRLTPEELLNIAVPSFSRQKVSIADIAVGIATEMPIRIGFPGLPEDPERAVSLEIDHGTVRRLLDGLVRADPRYEWRVAEDGVDIYPKERSERLLDATVSRFDI